MEGFQKTFGILPTVQAEAPGRIEFLGNHVDYNGGPVLGATLDRTVRVAVAPRDDRRIVLASAELPHRVETSVDRLHRRTGDESWANYLLGVVAVFQESGMRCGHGFSLWVESDLPVGAGLSSSAALELATAHALAKLYAWPIKKERMVALCRKAENDFVGVPCGILDQGVIGFGEKHHLVHIDCRNERFSVVPFPPEGRFWIFNTQRKHNLLESCYAERAAECRQAFAILRASSPDLGCLAEATTDDLTRDRHALGEVNWLRARHVVEECARVREAVDALQRGDLTRVGKLLYASHESSRILFQNSIPELDFLVTQLSHQSGVLGARLTGGGFGGAVMALTREDFGSAHAEVIQRRFAEEFGGLPLQVFPAQTSAGAR